MLSLKLSHKQLKSLKRAEVRNKSGQDIPYEQLQIYIQLDGSFNDLVTTEGISDFSSLQTLILSNNKIQFLTQLPPSLIHVNLSGNMINTLRDKFGHCILHNLKNLKTLNLSKNKLHTLQSNIFLQNRKLKILDLSFNKLYKNLVSISVLDELEILDLSNNLIRDLIQFQVFTKKLPNLQHIKIKNNPVTIPHARRCAISLCKNIPNLKLLDDQDIYEVANIPLLQPPEVKPNDCLEFATLIKSPSISCKNQKDDMSSVLSIKKLSHRPMSELKYKKNSSKKLRNLHPLRQSQKLETSISTVDVDEEEEYPLTTKSILNGLESRKKTKIEEIYQAYKASKRKNSATPRNLSSELNDPFLIKEEKQQQQSQSSHRIPRNNIFMNLGICEMVKIDKVTKCNISCQENDDSMEHLYPRVFTNEMTDDGGGMSNQKQTSCLDKFHTPCNQQLNEKKEIDYLRQINELREKLLKEKEEYFSSCGLIRELTTKLEKNKNSMANYKKLLALIIQDDQQDVGVDISQDDELFSSYLLEKYNSKMLRYKQINLQDKEHKKIQYEFIDRVENIINMTTIQLKKIFDDYRNNLMGNSINVQKFHDGLESSLYEVVSLLQKIKVEKQFLK